MAAARSMIALIALAAMFSIAQAQIQQAKTSYDLASIAPAIDAKTMDLHFSTHYQTYVNNTNAALNNATLLAAALPAGVLSTTASRSNLTALILAASKVGAPLNATLRNQAGGAYNHALYFGHLAPPGTAATNPSVSMSPALSAAVNASFGSISNMTESLSTAAKGVFGSGWAWLCYAGDKQGLVITTTPNQDNPLMGNLAGAPPVKFAGCSPILGVDVWEHAYYLKHGPKRAAYIADLFSVIDWQSVSNNYDAAKKGLPPPPVGAASSAARSLLADGAGSNAAMQQEPPAAKSGAAAMAARGGAVGAVAAVVVAAAVLAL